MQFHLFTNPSITVINQFIFGQEVVIYYITHLTLIWVWIKHGYVLASKRLLSYSSSCIVNNLLTAMFYL